MLKPLQFIESMVYWPALFLFIVPTHNKGGSIMYDVSEDIDTLHRLFDENKEVMDWLKDK